MILDPLITMYGISLNHYYGYKVLVHSPYDFPEVAGKGFTVGTQQESFIGIAPSYTESTETVKSMSLSRRKCITRDEPKENLPKETKLEAFRQYSRYSCLLECRARLMVKECGCLPYYYPNFASVWGIDTSCDLKGLKCLSQQSGEVFSCPAS